MYQSDSQETSTKVRTAAIRPPWNRKRIRIKLSKSENDYYTIGIYLLFTTRQYAVLLREKAHYQAKSKCAMIDDNMILYC